MLAFMNNMIIVEGKRIAQYQYATYCMYYQLGYKVYISNDAKNHPKHKAKVSKMKNCVDLHTHSTASDGSLSPRELIRLAYNSKLSAIALTDHDTVDGLEEAEQAANEFGIEFIRGCELSSKYKNYCVHIVGLFLPTDLENYPRFMEALTSFQNNREYRNCKMLEKLNNLGIKGNMQDLQNIAGGNIVGRPHFARFLCDTKVVHSQAEAFEKYLAKDKLAYVPRKSVSAHEAVSLLRDTKTLSVLAHPKLINCGEQELDTLVKELKELGLNAIEAYHSSHSQKDERELVGLAKKYDLLLSGGSDFHGSPKPKIQLGRGKGGLRVPYFILEKLKKIVPS